MPRNSEYIEDLRAMGRPRKYVLFENDFSTGNEGWNGLLDSGDNYYPTLDPHSITGPYSLRLDTMGHTAGVSAIACKRFWAFEGKYHFLFRFAWNGDAEGDLRYLRWVLDWQVDTDTRRWIEVKYTHYNQSTNAVLARWEVSDGNVNGMQEITDARIQGYELGFNAAHKYDFHEVEFSVTAIDGEYAWDTLRIDNQKVDISGFDLDNTQTAENDFANGSNILMYCTGVSDETVRPYVLIDYVRAEVEPTE